MIGMAEPSHQWDVQRCRNIPVSWVGQQVGKERAGHGRRPGSSTVDGPTGLKNYGARRCRISSSSWVEFRNYGECEVASSCGRSVRSMAGVVWSCELCTRGTELCAAGWLVLLSILDGRGGAWEV